MKPTSADDLRTSDAASSLRRLGETLAATASLNPLAGLIARQVRDATGARRVALVVRDQSGRLRAAGDVSQDDGGNSARPDVVALPLLVRAEVEAIVVVENAADRSALDTFLPQAAWAVAAVRAAQGGSGDAAAARARITAQVLHEVNNRLGAIQIYAYLLAERLRRGEDAGGIEVAGKLCSAVERLGTSIAELGASDVPPPGARSATDLDTLVDGCLASVADELAGRGIDLRRELGAPGRVSVHEEAMAEALRHVLRQLGSLDGASLAVSTRRLSPQAAAIVVHCAVGARRVVEALFAGESDELGRALLRDVVERQGGTVWVRGTGEDGALIHMELAGGAG